MLRGRRRKRGNVSRPDIVKPFYSSDARQVVKALFGEKATVSSASGFYFVSLGDDIIGAGPNIVAAIRQAVIARAAALGIAPLEFLERALERFLKEWSKKL